MDQHQIARFDEGLALECGVSLRRLEIAYCTYGVLNAEKSNAILVAHGLTSDHYIASPNPVTGKPGWWESVVGPGLPLDTNRYFVICSNVLGGCMGSTGPRTPHDDHPNRPWGIDFPIITIRDMVRAQKRLIDHLGITRLFTVVGASMGGMNALEWATTYPDSLFACVAVAATPWHSAQNIAFHEVGRQAIFADPDWRGGRYWEAGIVPARGLAVARMVAHITYLSETALTQKFGRRLQDGQALSLFGDQFAVESYLHYQGGAFVRRFDANAYLTITRAMDLFDLAAEYNGDLAACFARARARFCIISFSSDWLFPTSQSRAIVHALNRVAANVSFLEIESDKGHDAFLLDEPLFHRTLTGFLAGCAEQAGLRRPA